MPDLTLPLGYELNGANVRQVAQALIDGCPNGLPARVVIDFSQLDFDGCSAFSAKWNGHWRQ